MDSMGGVFIPGVTFSLSPGVVYFYQTNVKITL